MRMVFLLAALMLLGGWETLEAARGGGGTRVSPKARKAALQAQHRRIIEKLNLTPEQRKKIRAYNLEHRKRMAEIDAALHVKRVALEAEMSRPEPDAEKVQAITEEIGKLKAARDLQRLKAKKEINGILTPEQRENLRKIQQEEGSSGEERGGLEE